MSHTLLQLPQYLLVECRRVNDQQDGGQLHQAGERGADVKVGAGATRGQGETVVGGTAGEPAAGEAGGEEEEAGLQERGQSVPPRCLLPLHSHRGEREASRLHSVSTDNPLQHLLGRGPILSTRMDELPCAIFAKGPARTNTEMGAVNISKLICFGLRTG